MCLLQAIFTLRKPICNSMLSHCTSQVYRRWFRGLYIPGAFHCFYCNDTKNNIKVRYNQNRNMKIDTKNKMFGYHILKHSKDSRFNDVSNSVQLLNKIYSIVNQEFKKPSISYKYETNEDARKKMFKCIIDISWPMEMSFHSEEPSKKLGAHSAAKNCLNWLYDNKHITSNWIPKLYPEHEIKSMSLEYIRIDLNSRLKNELETIIDAFDKDLKSIIPAPSATNLKGDHLTINMSNNWTQENVSPDNHINQETNTKLDVTVTPSATNPKENDLKNDMHDKFIKNKYDMGAVWLQRQETLPIFTYKTQILDCLKDNQVLLIKGDTGCGKSTQVPQFIINAHEEEMKTFPCNILVSEPRRISTRALATRIAEERYEEIGNTVGYHVRFQKILPRAHNSILFCTTGILLRKIESNLTLEGVSHVIIDEAHQRTVETDILLKLLRNIVKVNPSLKLIIMSASINTSLLRKYFSCPIIEVPGQVYDTKMHFLDDLEIFDTNSSDASNFTNINILNDKIVTLIQWIKKNKPPGGILCFLPGWLEMMQLKLKLQKLQESQILPPFLIFPLHSKQPYSVQQQVFEQCPNGVEKIILATDIAEDGVTITDIKYIIDSVLNKHLYWDHMKSLYSLKIERISKANVLQRKGRVGRVTPGESYHLITKAEYNNLMAYPVPEIRRLSLDNIVIRSKLYSDQKAEDFFSDMLEKPVYTSLQHTVQRLKDLDIIDENENFTPLGARIKYFSLNPALSRAIVFSCIFQCCIPILTIAVLSTVDTDVSATALVGNSINRGRKEIFHPTSDHIAIYEMYKAKHITSAKLKDTIALCASELVNSGLSAETDSDLQSMNEFSRHKELNRAILFMATNHLAKVVKGKYRNGYFTKLKETITTENNIQVIPSSNSVNFKRKEWPSCLLTYTSRTETNNRCIVTDTSIISPLSVLLFSRGDVTRSKIPEENFDKESDVLISIDNLHNAEFICDSETADLLLKFRHILWSIVDYIIKYEGNESHVRGMVPVKSYKQKMMPVLVKMLDESSKDIDTCE